MRTTLAKQLLSAAITVSALTSACAETAVNPVREPVVAPPPENAVTRGELEGALKKNSIVAVIVKDGGLSSVPGCIIPGSYLYTDFGGIKTDEQEIASTGELHIALPFYVASIEASIAKGSKVTLLKAMVGRYDLKPGGVGSGTPLPASCRTATHLVRGATIGAFRFISGAKTEVQAKIDAWKIGAGGTHTESADVVLQEGDRAKCSAVQSNTPLAQCDALIALELEQLNLVAGGYILKDLYDNTTDIVRRLSQDDPSDANASNQYIIAAKSFWNYYWVKLLGVESHEVKLAMVAFGDVLSTCGYDLSSIRSDSPPKGFSAACNVHALKTLANSVEIATAADPRLNKK